MTDHAWKRIEVASLEPATNAITRILSACGAEYTINFNQSVGGSKDDVLAHVRAAHPARLLVDAARRVVGVGHAEARVPAVTMAIGLATLVPPMHREDRDAPITADDVMEWAAQPHVWRTRHAPAGGNVMGLHIGDDGEVYINMAFDAWSIVGREIIIRQRFAETIIGAMPGRMLREVVGIEDLAHIPLVVTRAEDVPVGTVLHVDIDGDASDLRP